jgi:hypothetical protein
MRSLIALTLFFIPASLVAATVEQGQSRDYSKLVDKENVEFLRNLAVLLEAKGLKDVRIIPQMFVATAKNDGGRDVTVIVDYNTLQAFSFEEKLPFVDAATASPKWRSPNCISSLAEFRPCFRKPTQGVPGCPPS